MFSLEASRGPRRAGWWDLDTKRLCCAGRDGRQLCRCTHRLRDAAEESNSQHDDRYSVGRTLTKLRASVNAGPVAALGSSAQPLGAYEVGGRVTKCLIFC